MVAVQFRIKMLCLFAIAPYSKLWTDPVNVSLQLVSLQFQWPPMQLNSRRSIIVKLEFCFSRLHIRKGGKSGGGAFMNWGYNVQYVSTRKQCQINHSIKKTWKKSGNGKFPPCDIFIYSMKKRHEISWTKLNRQDSDKMDTNMKCLEEECSYTYSSMVTSSTVLKCKHDPNLKELELL